MSLFSIKIRDHIFKKVYKKKVLGLEIDHEKLHSIKHVKEKTKNISCSKSKPYVRTSSNNTDDVQDICSPLIQQLNLKLINNS